MSPAEREALRLEIGKILPKPSKREWLRDFEFMAAITVAIAAGLMIYDWGYEKGISAQDRGYLAAQHDLLCGPGETDQTTPR